MVTSPVYKDQKKRNKKKERNRPFPKGSFELFLKVAVSKMQEKPVKHKCQRNGFKFQTLDSFTKKESNVY